VYRPHCEKQKREIERIQREEGMSLSPDLDYLSLPVSLSKEVREILDRVRPTTVSYDVISFGPTLLTQYPISLHETRSIHLLV